MGSRLTETREGSTTSYSYLSNAAGFNSPQLTSTRGDGAGDTPTRYHYDSAGNLVQVDRQDMKVQYHYNAENRLSQIRKDSFDRTPALMEFRYDGRGFLSQSTLTPSLGHAGQNWVTRATYSSDGVLHQRSTERHATPEMPRDTPTSKGEDYTFYFAGRPIAQLSVLSTTSAEGSTNTEATLIFLATDHLGTPILATDTSGNTQWLRGFEPFGNDYNAGQQAGVHLRFPGQWQDETWSESGLTDSLYYNVHRWYDTETGRYTRPDPIGVRGGINLFVYAQGNTLLFIDPLGERSVLFTGCEVIFMDDDGKIVKRCPAGSGLHGTKVSDQDKKFRGPMPEGKWTFNPREFSGGWLYDLFREDAWGRWRVPLHPDKDTDTRDRDGFFMHGDKRSNRPDTAGCVDVGDCDSWARDWAMEDPDTPIEFIVDYKDGKVCN